MNYNSYSKYFWKTMVERIESLQDKRFQNEDDDYTIGLTDGMDEAIYVIQEYIDNPDEVDTFNLIRSIRGIELDTDNNNYSYDYQIGFDDGIASVILILQAETIK